MKTILASKTVSIPSDGMTDSVINNLCVGMREQLFVMNQCLCGILSRS